MRYKIFILTFSFISISSGCLSQIEAFFGAESHYNTYIQHSSEGTELSPNIGLYGGMNFFSSNDLWSFELRLGYTFDNYRDFRDLLGLPDVRYHLDYMNVKVQTFRFFRIENSKFSLAIGGGISHLRYLKSKEFYQNSNKEWVEGNYDGRTHVYNNRWQLTTTANCFYQVSEKFNIGIELNYNPTFATTGTAANRDKWTEKHVGFRNFLIGGGVKARYVLKK